MIYVFDTSSFIVLGHYFPVHFPTFWQRFEAAVTNGLVVSTREVRRELDRQEAREHLREWIKNHKEVFCTPSPAETLFVRDIFSVSHFQQMISLKQRLQGKPIADPFVIAAAKVRDGCVVTEEKGKDNAAKIPNVCDHFSIPWTNLEGFLAREEWSF